MDEKELMIPLELGYVQGPRKGKELVLVPAENVVYVHDHKCMTTLLFFFIPEIPGGGEKQESKRWQGGRRAR